MHNPENIRNVAVVGHQGSGKTSLVESLAYKAGLIREKGTIEKMMEAFNAVEGVSAKLLDLN